jgi:hypothetical protein
VKVRVRVRREGEGKERGGEWEEEWRDVEVDWFKGEGREEMGKYYNTFTKESQLTTPKNKEHKEKRQETEAGITSCRGDFFLPIFFLFLLSRLLAVLSDFSAVMGMELIPSSSTWHICGAELVSPSTSPLPGTGLNSSSVCPSSSSPARLTTAKSGIIYFS